MLKQNKVEMINPLINYNGGIYNEKSKKAYSPLHWQHLRPHLLFLPWEHNTEDTFAFYSGAGTAVYSKGENGAPVMLEADQFMYGDVDGSGAVDGSDATRILGILQANNGASVKVDDVYGNYTSELPDMKTAYAADANKDGYITQLDAMLVLQYYANYDSVSSYTGPIGKIDIYEVY